MNNVKCVIISFINSFKNLCHDQKIFWHCFSCYLFIAHVYLANCIFNQRIILLFNYPYLKYFTMNLGRFFSKKTKNLPKTLEFKLKKIKI